MKKKWILIALVISLFLLKIFIVNAQIINVKGYIHDDRYFINSASSVLKYKWLGKYNDKTLSKGCVGILFIAFSSKLNIPYLLAVQIVYYISCIAIVRMINNIIKNKYFLFLVFIILFFNPISYSDAFSFVYRDGLYPSLIMLLIAYSFQVFFNYKEDKKKLKLYSILFGLVFSLIYLCREETLSLAPYIVCALVITILFIIKDKKCDMKKNRIFYIIGIPLVIFIMMTASVSSINYICYGRFITNDFTSKDFKDAYGALTRIKQKNYIKRVPLNKESREELYELSPTFRELKTFLEEGRGLAYIKKETNDYQEGFLYWAVREAVYELGYYKNAKTAKEYYERLAKEINDLCDQKKIECTSKRSSLIAPIYPETIDELIKYIPKTFITQITYKKVLVEFKNKDISVEKYEKITHNKVSYNSNDKYKISIMKFILKIYKSVNPFVMVFSFFSYLFIMIRFFIDKKKKNSKEIILVNGVLGMYLIRMGTIAFIAASEYTSVIEKCQYLAPTYPIQSLFSLLVIYFAIKEIKTIHKDKDYIIIKRQKKLYFFSYFYKKIPIYEMYKPHIKGKRLLELLPFKSFIMYGNWIFNLRNTKNVIIFETSYSNEISKYIKRVNPNCRIILYYWNTIQNKVRESYLKDKNIDDFYTFDKNDALKYNIKYNPQFYSSIVKLPKKNIKYDVFFIGRNKKRKKELLSLEKKMNKVGITTKFVIIDKEKDFISYNKYIDILSQSRVVLDYVNSNQAGLSLRCMESLFFEKKIITNNKYIKDYDFYNKNNILILRKNTSLKTINDFINSPYESIDKKIIKQYDYSSWIDRFNK